MWSVVNICLVVSEEMPFEENCWHRMSESYQNQIAHHEHLVLRGAKTFITIIENEQHKFGPIPTIKKK